MKRRIRKRAATGNMVPTSGIVILLIRIPQVRPSTRETTVELPQGRFDVDWARTRLK